MQISENNCQSSSYCCFDYIMSVDDIEKVEPIISQKKAQLKNTPMLVASFIITDMPQIGRIEKLGTKLM